MIPIKEATRVAESYKNMCGETKEIKKSIFSSSEFQRAETIINALRGLTIESAQQLLERVNLYMLQQVID